MHDSGSNDASADLPTRGERPAAVYTLAAGAALGRYIVLEQLGRGGMGVVYAAYDPQLDRRVAVKVLRGDGGESGHARLMREAQALARVSHPNVIAVHDVGVVDEFVFIAMDLVEGVTLREWLKQARALDEILRVLLAAGAGLAAAHAAGIVHRDFKPDNLLVGAAGQARVVDFGVARAEGDDSAVARAAAGSPLDLSLTRTGHMLGTPAYMAPEQLAGRADARSDQFSFCVTLYEALYGARPYQGDTIEALEGAFAAGRVPAPPSQGRVPSHLRAALLRGLEPVPERRFPSMAALLDALAHDPRARRVKLALGAGAAILAVVAVALPYRAARSRALSCAVDDAPWNAAAAPRVTAALRTAGATPTSLTTVTTLLSSYASGLNAMRSEACAATRVRGVQTEHALELRMACLDRRGEQLRSLVGELGRADHDVAAQAVQAVSQLPSLRSCADVAALEHPLALPRDARLRQSIAGMRRRLAEVTALTDAGRYPAGLAAAKTLAADADAVPFLPVQAEARFALGALYAATGEPKRAADEHLAALTIAMRANDDEVIARAATGLVEAHGDWLGHRDEAHRWAQVGRAALSRLGSADDLRADLDVRECQIFYLDHDSDGALRVAREAVELSERLEGAESFAAAEAYNCLGSAFAAGGRFAEQEQADLRSLALRRALVGDEHVSVFKALNNLGVVAESLRQYQRAAKYEEDAVARAERIYGADNPNVAVALANLAEAAFWLKDLPRAEALLRRAVAINEQHFGRDDLNSLTVYGALGEVLLLRDGRREALPLLEHAVALGVSKHAPAGDLAYAQLPLARAVADTDPPRALALATAALAGYTEAHDAPRIATARAFLDARKR